MRRVLASIASRVDPSAHPLLDERAGAAGRRPTLLIVITRRPRPVRQLQHQHHQGAGAFIVENRGREVALGLVGRQGRDYFGRRGFAGALRARQPVRRRSSSPRPRRSPQPAIEDFIDGKVDSVHLIYNEFKSVMQQQRRGRAAAAAPARRIRATERRPRRRRSSTCTSRRPSSIFDELLPPHVEAQVLRALLESNARSTPRR